MPLVNYTKSSPYYNTNQNSYYLEYWNPPLIAPNANDQIFVVTNRYVNRPDLLSWDAYGTPKLWWVFAMANPNQIRDPIADLQGGMEIRIPSKDSLQGFI
jgi:hypothetical protein